MKINTNSPTMQALGPHSCFPIEEVVMAWYYVCEWQVQCAFNIHFAAKACFGRCQSKKELYVSKYVDGQCS